jgi:glutamyl-tRNA synthetase
MAGYLPETLVNFIALLGWNPGDQRERMSLSEMVESFSLERLGKANAKFDRAKLLAFNTESAASVGVERLLAGFRDFLAVNSAAAAVIPAGDEQMLRRLIQANKGFRTYQDIVDKTAVLFGPDDAFAYDEKAAAKVLARNEGEGFRVLGDLRPKLADCSWDEEGVKGLIDGVCQAGGLGMNKVAQPIRVAVTGSTISPAIYDTLLILGREKTLARIDRCLKQHKA